MMEKQTIVVKVGTSSLTLSDGTMDAEKIRNITTQLAALQTAGHHVILVSSGAIAAGFSRLGFKKRPTKIADKQAAAAGGIHEKSDGVPDSVRADSFEPQ